MYKGRYPTDFILTALVLVLFWMFCVLFLINHVTEYMDSIDNRLDIVEQENIESRKSYETKTIEEEVEVEENAVYETVAQMPEFGFDFEYVAGVVMTESQGEPYEGQVAVAQCILNTSLVTDMTAEEVVKQPNQYADATPYDKVSQSVIDACIDVFINGYTVTDEPIRYFYAPKYMENNTSKWHEENLEYVLTINNHKFFK